MTLTEELEDLAAQEFSNMEVIQLRSSVNWCKHELRSLRPVDPSLHPTEKVFKFISPHRYEILRNEKNKLPIGIAFAYGPVLYIGEVNEQLGMTLKDICTAFNKETGEEKYLTLIFDYDISGNEETGIV